jgi:multidrug efflux system membrane fusion protein
MRRQCLLRLFPGFLVLAITSGCQREQPPPSYSELPVIPVSHPVEREVTDYVSYTGRTDAVQTVGVRPRVSGYLVRITFLEGAMVQEGDLLFEIDPRPYKAMVNQARSQVVLNQAQLRLAQTTYARDQTVAASAAGAVSPQQLDQDRAAVDEAQARIKAAEAVLDAYKLNLSFTQIRSPITGQISRTYYTVGNLVNQDQTLLTTIVSVDPMYAYFDVDERTLLSVRKAINEGKIKPRDPTASLPTLGTSLLGLLGSPPGQGPLLALSTVILGSDRLSIPVLMGLEGEDNYPNHGIVDFINNAVNPSTGTIAVRGAFANPRPSNGRRLLSPGMFVRIRLPIGEPHQALLVIDRAIGSDQGLKFVYVVDAQHKVQYRRVTTGALQEDGLRVVEGLTASDWVVIGGLQQVRPLMEVEPEERPMPTVSGDQAPVPESGKPQPPPPGENPR